MGISAGLSVLTTGVQIVGAVKNARDKADAIEEQAKYQNQILDINQKLSAVQAQDAIKRGGEESSQLGTKVGQIVGAERTGFAANNVDISSGSALKTQEDTARNGELDQIRIKNNAWREAWGYKVQAANNSIQGQLSNVAANNNARSTLVTGGLQALNYGVEGYKNLKGYMNSSPSTSGE